MQRIGIFGSPNGVYVRELVTALANCYPACAVMNLSFSDMAVSLIDGQLKVQTLAMLASAATSTQPPGTLMDLQELDAIIVRTMPLGSLEQVIFRMDALQALERSGIAVINPPRTLEIAIDKWLTLERLARQGIATPRTIACQSREMAMAAFEELGNDVVVKPIFGGEGRGIVRVSDADMAWRVFSTLTQLNAVLYVQQFIVNFGYDIRVLKIGQRWLSVKRRAANGQWRTNVSLGSQAEPHELTDQELSLAQRAAEATGGSLLGIDLLPTCAGPPVVLEVNAVPGWRGTARALGVNIADLVAEHLKELHVARA